MIDFKQLQKDVYQNKVNHGFNVTDMKIEFLNAYDEMSEAYSAWALGKDDLGEELADVVIFMMGIAEMSNIDLGSEIQKKIKKNASREYKTVNGVPVRIDK